MSRSHFIYIALVVIVALGGWFFASKFRSVGNDSDLNDIAKPEESSGADSFEEEKHEEQKPAEWIKFDNGLEMQDVIVGSGPEAKAGYAVAAHYLGTLADGKKFDSSYDRGEPFVFVLGQEMVIKGWDLGLVGMKVGGKRKLVIPPALGYGDKEVGGGIIPANSTLYFDIELVGVQAPGENQ